jgi:hypothetical protein
MAHLLDTKFKKLYETYKRNGIHPLISHDDWPKFDKNWIEGHMPDTPEGQVLALLERLHEATDFRDDKADWMVFILRIKKFQYELLKDDAPFTYNTLYWGAQKDGEINDEIIKKCYEEILKLAGKKYPHKVSAVKIKKLKEAEKKHEEAIISNYRRQVELQKELEKLRREYTELKNTPIKI